MPLNNDYLIDLLQKSRLVSESDLEATKKIADHLGCLITDVLLGRGIISHEGLGQILSEYYGTPYVDLSKMDISPEVLKLIPENLSAIRNVIAFNKKENNVYLAMEEPHDLEAVETIKKTLGGGINIIPYVTTRSNIENALKLYKLKSIEEQVSPQTGEISIIPEVDSLLDNAIREEASDIHFEPLDDRLLVRYRIDGVLHDRVAYPKNLHPEFVARIKILSELKLDETRLPQDGQFSHADKRGEKISFRVSVVPSVYGEKVVLRLLESAITGFSLEELGLLPEDQQVAAKVLDRSHGMLLVTGPTGSGKTTTLYTLLNLLNKSDVNIVTIEDPVENRLRRVNQIQVHAEVGLVFASGLRSILRQDPDIIMVGEIRDQETAVIAVNAAMTGHLVFSTVHANTSAGAIPRLINLGAEPFLIASTLNMVIAQRLVRVLCPKCMKEIPLSTGILQKLDQLRERISPEIFKMVTGNYEAVGCQNCFNTGFRGRTGIFELLPVDDSIKKMIALKATSNEIWDKARLGNAKTMLEDGLIKVSRGITTLEEVLRVISE